MSMTAAEHLVNQLHLEALADKDGWICRPEKAGFAKTAELHAMLTAELSLILHAKMRPADLLAMQDTAWEKIKKQIEQVTGKSANDQKNDMTWDQLKAFWIISLKDALAQLEG